ncbi:hypothetical protein M422DRAFT_33689, partial [Sphaerobolus stellatus SS14]
MNTDCWARESRFVVSRGEGGISTIPLCQAWNKEDRMTEEVQRIARIPNSRISTL